MGQENDPYAYGMSRTHMGRPIRVWDKIRVRDGTQPRKYFQRNFKTVKYLQPNIFQTTVVGEKQSANQDLLSWAVKLDGALMYLCIYVKNKLPVLCRKGRFSKIQSHNI